jgi:hypothetical protein
MAVGLVDDMFDERETMWYSAEEDNNHQQERVWVLGGVKVEVRRGWKNEMCGCWQACHSAHRSHVWSKLYVKGDSL